MNQTYSGYAHATPITYALHLDQPAWLDFDAYKSSATSTADAYLYWSLSGANGRLFQDRPTYGQDPMRLLPAGDYSLKVFSSHVGYAGYYQRSR